MNEHSPLTKKLIADGLAPRKISRRPCANLRKMNAAVERWISEAEGKANGHALLAEKTRWISEQIAILGRDGALTPAHLVGLTVWDLMEAESALFQASKGRAAA